MSARESQQPTSSAQQMGTVAPAEARLSSEQPRPNIEQMSTEPAMKMRGGGEGEDVCCGLCAACACFECLNCCC